MKTTITSHVCFNPAEAREGFKISKAKEQAKEKTNSFNPAEAREGFKIKTNYFSVMKMPSFNPAEAREGFKISSLNTILNASKSEFQSSRSQRRV